VKSGARCGVRGGGGGVHDVLLCDVLLCDVDDAGDDGAGEAKQSVHQQ
jgi:hypothetical protein